MAAGRRCERADLSKKLVRGAPSPPLRVLVVVVVVADATAAAAAAEESVAPLSEYLGLWPPVPMEELPLRGLSFGGVTRIRWTVEQFEGEGNGSAVLVPALDPLATAPAYGAPPPPSSPPPALPSPWRQRRMGLMGHAVRSGRGASCTRCCS